MFDEQLVIIGTGINSVGQLTIESAAWIMRAEKLFYLVVDPVAEEIIKQLNPEAAENLIGLYVDGKPRIQTYEEMINLTLESVRAGKMTVSVSYGHPGVFDYPAHESIRRARREGYRARMLPGISAEDCLFADLNIDPADKGCQSFEATDFLVYNRALDNSSIVILWQIGLVGDLTFNTEEKNMSFMPYLLERLYQYYDETHNVIIYEAPTLPGFEPVIKKVPLFFLPYVGLSTASTLLILSAREAVADTELYNMITR